MQVPRDLSRRMLEAVDQVPTVDVYERLVPESKRINQRVDFIAWFMAYAGVEVQALGLKAEELALLGNVQAEPNERWSLLAEYWPYIRTTGTGRTILRIVWELFGVEEVDERTWKDISASLWKACEKGFYHALLRERANIHMTLVDNAVDPDTLSCCAPIKSYDWLLSLRCRADIERVSLELGEEPSASLELLDILVEKSVQRDVEEGGVAFRLHSLPDVAARGSPEEVEWAFGRVFRCDSPDDLSKIIAPVATQRSPVRSLSRHRRSPCRRWKQLHLRGESTLYNYLVDRFLTHVTLSERPVQVQVSSDATVERLNILARRYPTIRFLCVYTGGPDPFALLTLGRTLPNVALAIGDLWRIAPQVAQQALRSWLHGVPLNKVFAFGGGTTMVEAACVQALIVREQIAVLLAEMVAAGDLDEKDARLAMERVLYKNAWDYFHFEQID